MPDRSGGWMPKKGNAHLPDSEIKGSDKELLISMREETCGTLCPRREISPLFEIQINGTRIFNRSHYWLMMIVYLRVLSDQKPFRSNDNVTPGRYKRYSECFLMDSPPRATTQSPSLVAQPPPRRSQCSAAQTLLQGEHWIRGDKRR